MREVSPAAKELAQRLLWNEAGGRLESDVLAAAAERAFDRLGRRLSDLLGQAGFIALVGRALHLAQREYPILISLALAAKPDERLFRFREFGGANSDNPTTVAKAFTALLAHLIWLLITFVGDNLTFHLIDEIWPELDQVARDPSTQIWRDDA